LRNLQRGPECTVRRAPRAFAPRLLGAICAAIIVLISLQDPTFLGAEWLLQDAFTRRLATRSPLDPRVVIVSVNEKSVRTLDQAGFGNPVDDETFTLGDVKYESCVQHWSFQQLSCSRELRRLTKRSSTHSRRRFRAAASSA
jgi:CHASE2 domain-containing sensor protein